MIRLTLAIAAALGVLAALLALAGVPLRDVAVSFVEGTTGWIPDRGEFVGWQPVSEVLRRATPLVLTGLAVQIALQAGLFNIGAEGQLRVGGLVAAWACLSLGLSGPLGIVVATILGAAAGLLWAAPAAWIRAFRGGHEVISTIMLNYVAVLATEFVVSGPMQERPGGEPTTAVIPEAASLSAITFGGGFVLYPALLVGIGLAILARLWLNRTPPGFEHRLVGANPSAAAYAGVKTKWVSLRALLLSGAVAGVAGALHLLGQERRYSMGFSPGYGFDSLGVALLAGGHPLGVLPAALLFAAIEQGAVRAQVAIGLPKEISFVIQGLLLLLVAYVRWRRRSTL